eukprot:747544-Hanusia_phi.AAC.1
MTISPTSRTWRSSPAPSCSCSCSRLLTSFPFLPLPPRSLPPEEEEKGEEEEEVAPPVSRPAGTCGQGLTCCQVVKVERTRYEEDNQGTQ